MGNRNETYTFFSILAFLAAILTFSGVIGGSLELGSVGWLVLLFLALGIGFTGASINAARGTPDETRVINKQTSGTGGSLTIAGTEVYQESTDEPQNPEPARPVAQKAAQAGWTGPAASEQPTVTEPLRTEEGEQIGDAEVTYTDPIDRAATTQPDPDNPAHPDNLDTEPETMEEQDDAVVIQEETTGEDGSTELPNAADTGAAPAAARPARDSERRLKAVNEEEMETDTDRREAAATGATVDDSKVAAASVPTGELTDAPATTPQEQEAEEEVVENGADAPEEQVEVAPRRETVEPDKLTRIEGIGPKMSKALIAGGVDTFEKLSKMSIDDIRAVLDEQGQRFAPSAESWAEQASYAAKGDWDGLNNLQGRLVAGRYPTDE